MTQVSLVDRVLAIVLLGIGIAALGFLLPALRGAGIESGLPGSEAVSLADDAPSFVLRASAFFVGGIGSFVGALSLWTGRGFADRKATRSTAPSFGRTSIEGPNRRSPSRYGLLLFPFAALMLLAVDHSGIWPRASPELVATVSTEETGPSVPQMSPSSAPSFMPLGETALPELAAGPSLAAPPPIGAPGMPAALSAPAEPGRTTAPLPAAPVLPVGESGHRGAVVHLSMAPDGKSFVSSGIDHAIKLWDTGTQKLVRDLGAHKDMARAAQFTPDGTSVMSAGDDGELVMWDIADGSVLHVFAAPEHGRANGVAISPDGRRAVSVHEAATVIVWDLASRTVERVMTGHSWSINGVAVAPDSRTAITGSIEGTLKLWDIATGDLVRSWGGHERGTYGAVFTADGKGVFTASADRTLKLWDVESGAELKRYTGHSNIVYAVAISPDGTSIASASTDGTARIWDVASGAERSQFSGHIGPVWSVAYAPDGTVITGGEDHSIRFWSTKAGGQVAMIPGAPQ